MNHNHIVHDMDKHFVIDPITREITNAESKKNTLQQYDHNSEIFSFEVPRQVEGHDMTLCNRVEVHYINIDGSSRATSFSSVYEVQDLQIDPEDKDKVLFTWMVSSNATQYAGPLNFIISFICTEEDEVTYRWNTSINKSITIASSMNNGEEVTERYDDVLLQWYEKLFGIGETEEMKMIQLSIKHQNLIRELSDKEQAEIGVLSAECKREIKSLSTACQSDIIELSDGGKTEIIELSNSGKTEIKTLSDKGKTEIKELSDKGKIEIKELSIKAQTDISDKGKAILDNIPTNYANLGAEVNKLVKSVGAYSMVNGTTTRDIYCSSFFCTVGKELELQTIEYIFRPGYIDENGIWEEFGDDPPNDRILSKITFFEKGTLVQATSSTEEVIIYQCTEPGDNIRLLAKLGANESYTFQTDCHARIGCSDSPGVFITPSVVYYGTEISCESDEVFSISGSFDTDYVGVVFVKKTEVEKTTYGDPTIGYNDHDGWLSETGDYEIYESTPPDDQTVSELVFFNKGTKIVPLGTGSDDVIIYEYTETGEKVGLLTSLVGGSTYIIPHDCYVRVGCENGAGIRAYFLEPYVETVDIVVDYMSGSDCVDNASDINITIPRNVTTMWIFTTNSYPIIRKILLDGDVASHIKGLESENNTIMYDEPNEIVVSGYDDLTASGLSFNRGDKIESTSSETTIKIYEDVPYYEDKLLVSLNGLSEYVFTEDYNENVSIFSSDGSYVLSYRCKIPRLENDLKTFATIDNSPISDDSDNYNEFCSTNCVIGDPLMIDRVPFFTGSKQYFATKFSCEYGDVFSITGSFHTDYVGIVFIGESKIIDFKTGQYCIDNSSDLRVTAPKNASNIYIFTIKNYPIVKTTRPLSVAVEELSNMIDRIDGIEGIKEIDKLAFEMYEMNEELTSKIDSLDEELTSKIGSLDEELTTLTDNKIPDLEREIDSLKTRLLANEVIHKADILDTELTFKTNALEMELAKFIGSEMYNSVDEIKTNLDANEDAISTLQLAIQNSNGIVVGGEEPEKQPYIWFDTLSGQGEVATVSLLTSDDDTNNETSNTKILVDEIASKLDALDDKFTAKIDGLDAELEKLISEEAYDALRELKDYFDTHENAIDELQTAIQNSTGIIVGDTEPEKYPYIWFDTLSEQEQPVAATMSLSTDNASYSIVNDTSDTNVMINELASKVDALNTKFIAKIDALNTKLVKLIGGEVYDTLVGLSEYLDANKDAINELRTTVQNGNEIVVGNAEPEGYPYIWFDTSLEQEQPVVATMSLSEDGDSAVITSVDGVSYSVDNATSNEEPIEEGQYNFTII